MDPSYAHPRHKRLVQLSKKEKKERGRHEGISYARKKKRVPLKVRQGGIRASKKAPKP